MTKKHRLSFSAVSVDNKKIVEQKTILGSRSFGNVSGGMERKKITKSSTYQYAKKGFRQHGRKHPFGARDSFKNLNENKISPPEAGVIRIIPLGGVEEIGKNMTAIEIGEDIIVIDAGMHFSNEATPGVDYV